MKNWILSFNALIILTIITGCKPITPSDVIEHLAEASKSMVQKTWPGDQSQKDKKIEAIDEALKQKDELAKKLEKNCNESERNEFDKQALCLKEISNIHEIGEKCPFNKINSITKDCKNTFNEIATLLQLTYHIH